MKLVKRLLLPYFIAEILFYPIWFVVCHEAGYLKYLWDWCKVDSRNALLNIFISNGASNDLILGQLWFLPVLLFAEIIFIELYNRLYKASAEFFVAAIKRLLLPYFIAEILFYPIWFVVCHEAGYLKYLWDWCKVDSRNALLNIFISNGASNDLILGQLWFLPVLLFAEIIFIELYNRLYKASAEFFVAAIFLVAYVGFNVKNFFFLPLGIDIALTAHIFLLVGVLIRKNNLIELIDIKTYAVLTLILILAVYLNSFVDMHSRRYGDSFLFYAGGISGTLLVMKFSALMTGGKIFSLISDCGRQSMMILVLHPIVANIAYEIIVSVLNFPAEKIFTDTAVVFFVTAAGVFIPLFVAKKFGRLPVLKYFCA